MMKTPVQPRSEHNWSPRSPRRTNSLRHQAVPKMSTPSYLDPRTGTGFGSCQHSEEQLANHLTALLFFFFAAVFIAFLFYLRRFSMAGDGEWSRLGSASFFVSLFFFSFPLAAGLSYPPLFCISHLGPAPMMNSPVWPREAWSPCKRRTAASLKAQRF